MNGCVESISKCKVRPFCRFTIYEQRVEPPYLCGSACKKGVRNTKTHAEPQRQGGETYTRRSAPNLPFSAPLRAKKQPEPPRSTQSRRDKETKQVRSDLPAPSFLRASTCKETAMLHPRNCKSGCSIPQREQPTASHWPDSTPQTRGDNTVNAGPPHRKRKAITP